MRLKLSTPLLFYALAWLTLAGLPDLALAGGKDYQALSLDDCLALARQDNPVLSASRERVQELVADYQAARSKFFPGWSSRPIMIGSRLTGFLPAGP